MTQTKRFHPDKRSNAFIKDLIRDGWTFEKGSSGHIKIRSPKGTLVSMSASPSCPYAHENMVRDVRRVQKKDLLDD